jgi:hypothetical protein
MTEIVLSHDGAEQNFCSRSVCRFSGNVGAIRFRSDIAHRPSAAIALQRKFLYRSASQFSHCRSFGFYDNDDIPTT